MYTSRTIATIGVAIMLFTFGPAARATAAPDLAAPVRPVDHASAQRVSLADKQPGDFREADRAGAESSAAGAAVASKLDESPAPTSDSFVLLGMGIVLVGVVARQRRRFSRSGTILSR